jgi:lipid-A-disaccharide synthase
VSDVDSPSSEFHVYLIAGEPSGDALGAALMRGLHSLSNPGRDLRFSGIGGPQMTASGLTSLFDYSELAIMGLVEVLPRIVGIRRRMIETVRAIERDPPDILVTIDAPGFTVGVVKRLAAHDFPRVHYVAPSVWAWRPWRVHKFRRNFDHLMTLLPFEPPYFQKVGLDSSFVGHPVLQSGAGAGNGEAFRDRHGIPADAEVIIVLPGSRRGEVSRMIAPFGAALDKMKHDLPNLRAVIPAMPAVEDMIRAAVADWTVEAVVVRAMDERYDAMAAANLALAASGTVSLELAISGLPSVISYRMSPVTVWLLRRMVKVKYANLVNIILGREAVPELIQEAATPDRLAEELLSILQNSSRSDGIIAAQKTAIESLRAPNVSGVVRDAGETAASVVYDVANSWKVDT